MRIAGHDIAAIKALGYTEDEARFLYIVATHSGYFVPRQFILFANVEWGKRSAKFTHKLESRGHACWQEYQDTGRVYHLFSKTIYSAIGKENLRNRRRHSPEFIQTRLVLLDFVIANQQHHYLEMEQQKVQYFCEQLGISKKSLPTKAYEGSRGTEPTLRYFVDKYPLFLGSSDLSTSPVITFSFVDPGQASIKAFATHLNAYEELFRQLNAFRFLYISNSPANFVRAEGWFSERVVSALSSDMSGEILRYFRLRKAWDLKKYALFSNAEIESLNDAAKRFHGERFDALYSAWSSDRLSAEAIRREFAQTEPHRNVGFGTFLVRGESFPMSTRKERGEVDFTPALHP
ncbi:MAG TPA: hypothetical protein VHX36_09700 [Candidatus Acidoferrales bacterium]|jgi:hypothetical protein|nr:hypothetical protein [Candidatus Acidoferrales bacterium]